jgi:hypothetical protein
MLVLPPLLTMHCSQAAAPVCTFVGARLAQGGRDVA